MNNFLKQAIYAEKQRSYLYTIWAKLALKYKSRGVTITYVHDTILIEATEEVKDEFMAEFYKELELSKFPADLDKPEVNPNWTI